MGFQAINVPEHGDKITYADGKLNVPDHPILAYIEGDGIGPDIMRASLRIWDAAVEKAYGGQRKIAWMEIYCGEKAQSIYGGNYMPEETFDALREYYVGIKGPLTTPVGDGFRSLNVTLRQVLDLYACVRPVRWYRGVPSPVKHPEEVDVVIFRENTEDVYAGIEYEAGTPENAEARALSARRNGRDILRGRGHRHQADQRVRHQAPGARGDPAMPLSASARASRWCTRATFRSSPKARSASGATKSRREEFPNETITWDEVRSSSAARCRKARS